MKIAALGRSESTSAIDCRQRCLVDAGAPFHAFQLYLLIVIRNENLLQLLILESFYETRSPIDPDPNEADRTSEPHNSPNFSNFERTLIVVEGIAATDFL